MEAKKIKAMAIKGGSGSITYRIPLPTAWAKQIGLNKDNLEVELTFDEKSKEIKIKKLDYSLPT